MEKKTNVFEWFMAEIGIMLAGIFFGFSLPIGANLFPFPDFFVFLPLTVITAGLSFYYKFVKK